MRRSAITPLCIAVLTLAAIFLFSGDAGAYDRYSIAKDATNCRACHGDFRSSPYFPPSGAPPWSDDLHDVHRVGMVSFDCDVCHGAGPRFPVLMDISAGGDGLDPVSCVGCHARAEDDSVANGGLCVLPDCSPGAGLQQHHFVAGETVCADCHLAADPAFYLPVGEDVPPAYYANPGNGHPNIPADPCADDFNGEGGPEGQDNDGDGDYDGNDSDCGPPTGCTSDADCDNGDFCDGSETCDTGTGECVPGTAPDCDDGVSCTADSCNEGTDTCDNAPDDAVCDDGAFCNGDETCDAVNDCQPGTTVDCDDGVGCTDDSCNEANDSCDNTPDDALCDNGEFCDGTETCDPANDCQPGTPVDPDDGVGCTDDSCDEVNDTVVNAPNDALCDNGQFCDGTETCDAAADCQTGMPPCDPTAETCDEGGDVCVPIGCQSDAECDNGAFCDGSETCDTGTGQCLPGMPVDCVDGVSCTIDSCNEGSDSCDNVPDDAVCANGVFCDGTETCDPVNDCQAGTPVNCADGVGCTIDSCNEGTDSCDNTPNDAVCDNGQFCDGSETCDAAADCQSGMPPCDPTAETCDEGGDVCVPIGCQSDAECDNGAFCDGSETCDTGTGQCLPGMPVDCVDGVSCTIDSCNEGSDSCDNVPDDAVCANGVFCDGTETCDPVNDCQPGTPIDPNDGVGCTEDSCDEVNDTVVNAPNDALCDNGEFCDGSETCDAVDDCQTGMPPCDPTTETCDEGGDVCVPIGCQSDADCDNGAFCDGSETCDTGTGQCLSGMPVDCADGVSCTMDSCNEGSDSCDNVPNDALCDDGVFCNGAETCDAVNDCQMGMSPSCDDGVSCTIDFCDPAIDQCVNDDSACVPADFCPRSSGFWKSHPSEWPVDTLILGGVLYDMDALLGFLNSHGKDASLKLARQLTATKLNLAAGSDPVIQPVVTAADAFLVVHPPGSNPSGADKEVALQLKDDLDAYNSIECDEGDSDSDSDSDSESDGDSDRK